MAPEAKLADFARRIHLQHEDVDYLLSLLQEARGLGSLAGAATEREACAKIADTLHDQSGVSSARVMARIVAKNIRERGNS